jgi:hypothetical protein
MDLKLQKDYRSSLTVKQNKLVRFSLASFLHVSLIFQGKPGSYSSVASYRPPHTLCSLTLIY